MWRGRIPPPPPVPTPMQSPHNSPRNYLLMHNILLKLLPFRDISLPLTYSKLYENIQSPGFQKTPSCLYPVPGRATCGVRETDGPNSVSTPSSTEHMRPVPKAIRAPFPGGILPSAAFLLSCLLRVPKQPRQVTENHRQAGSN